MHGDAPNTQTFDFSNPDLYNPVYVPLFHDTHRFLHLFGSAGSGKSVFAAQKEIVLSFLPQRRHRKTLVIRKVYATIPNSVYAELNGVIQEWGLGDCFRALKAPWSILNVKSGVEFAFVGLDDVEKVKSIKGIDRIWIEEATELNTLSDLDQLSLRVRGFREKQITLSYNPINVHHWLNKEIHTKMPGGHRIFKTTYRDNLKLLAKDPDYAESIEALAITNPNYYRVYGLGLWGQQQEGLVYPDFRLKDAMPKDSDGRLIVQAYGCDFGYNDPTTLHELAIIDEPGKEKRQLYAKEILYQNKLTSDGLVAKLGELEVRKDVPIIGDSARPEMLAALQAAGYWAVPCEKGSGSVVAGINTVKLHDIAIIRGSKETIKEIENYSWKNKNGEWLDVPQDGADHAMDGIRYGTTYLARPISSGSEEFEDWV